MVYFDDILTFSKHNEENLHYIQAMFELFKQNKLYINLKKCEFLSNELLF